MKHAKGKLFVRPCYKLFQNDESGGVLGVSCWRKVRHGRQIGQPLPSFLISRLTGRLVDGGGSVARYHSEAELDSIRGIASRCAR